VGFVALVAQIVRYPQAGGKEIKASYLMFAAPAFAVFSVASWLAVARRHRLAGIVLVVAAGLYAVSYPVSLGSALSQPYRSLPRLGAHFGSVDLGVAAPADTGTASLGSPRDVTIYVSNTGTGTANAVTLVIRLSPGMRLLGPPFHERGPGCTGRRTIRSNPPSPPPRKH